MTLTGISPSRGHTVTRVKTSSAAIEYNFEKIDGIAAQVVYCEGLGEKEQCKHQGMQ